MKKIFLALIMSSSMVMAHQKGTAEVPGDFRATRKPEFARVNFTVQSQCYKTPAEASEANDGAVARIQEILDQYVDAANHIDEIVTEGGYATDYSKSVYTDGHSTVLCQDTYQQTTTVSFKSEIDGFKENFGEIRGLVLGEFARADAGGETPTTFVRTSEPEADVCAETRKAMRLEARSGAAKEAKANFFASVGSCCQKAKIVKIADRSEVGYRSLSASYAARESAPVGDGSVRLNFEDIAEEASLLVTFSFHKIKVRCDAKEDEEEVSIHH